MSERSLPIEKCLRGFDSETPEAGFKTQLETTCLKKTLKSGGHFLTNLATSQLTKKDKLVCEPSCYNPKGMGLSLSRGETSGKTWQACAALGFMQRREICLNKG